MPRLRLLVWLIALVALVAPPGLSLHAMATPGPEAAMVDCHDPAPPPCPDEGTARHAASTCCPLMAGAVALLSPATAIEAPLAGDAPTRSLARRLSSLSLAKDPPPPRV